MNQALQGSTYNFNLRFERYRWVVEITFHRKTKRIDSNVITSFIRHYYYLSFFICCRRLWMVKTITVFSRLSYSTWIIFSSYFYSDSKISYQKLPFYSCNVGLDILDSKISENPEKCAYVFILHREIKNICIRVSAIHEFSRKIGDAALNCACICFILKTIYVRKREIWLDIW